MGRERTTTLLLEERRGYVLLEQGHYIKGNPGSIIICSGGKTGGDNWISEGQAMKEFLMQNEHFRIPECDILAETEAKGTASNVIGVSQILSELDLQDDASITVIVAQRQCGRVRAYFKAHGYLVQTMLVREALDDLQSEFPVPECIDKPNSFEDNWRNALFWLLRIVDPRGILLSRYVMKKREWMSSD